MPLIRANQGKDENNSKHQRTGNTIYFKYVRSDVTYGRARTERKLNRFNTICGAISKHLKNETRRDAQKTFLKTIVLPNLMSGNETWVTTTLNKRRE